jgi:creatinine amidohydrolase/Fe(II)-dependent formamide hydrolase-like protein
MLLALTVPLAAPGIPVAHAGEREAASVFVDDLTSTELAARVRAGTTTVLIPIGGSQQSGARVALGKHNARARALAERIAAKLGDALVAPVIAYVPEGRIDPPTGHMRHPGTISVAAPAFEQVIEDAARSFRAHGFRDIVLLGDHGGYQQNEQAVAARLNRQWARSGTRVHPVPEYYRAASVGFGGLLRSRGYSDAEIGVHAGLADTALTLALAPALVRPARPGDAAVPGVSGDARRATAELGELGVNLIVDDTVAAVRAARGRILPSPPLHRSTGTP